MREYPSFDQVSDYIDTLVEHLSLDRSKIIHYHPNLFMIEMGVAGMVQPRGAYQILMFAFNNSKAAEMTPEEVIAHEMIHVQQIQQGKLITGYRSVVWEGEEWFRWYQDVLGTGNIEAYKALPWEKEAIERQTELAKLLKVEALA